MLRTLAPLVAAGLLLPVVAQAQDRLLMFSVTTATDESGPRARVDYELGVGESVFHQQISNGPEQRFGIQAASGRLTFVGHVGVAATNAAYQTSQQGELLVSVLNPRAPSTFALGGGVLHEAGGTNVLIGRVVAGHQGTRSLVQGNLVFQKPFEAGRDTVDLITSLGWSARVTAAWSVGVEMIGEDLEGFWSSEEAEGGARLLAGPSIRVAPPRKQWQVLFAGGPTFHPRPSPRFSDAVRNLPPTTAARDYAARATLSWRF